MTKTNEKVEDLRQKGNECVKAKNYAESVIHYTHALKLDPNIPQLYSNRSLSFFKLKQYYYAMEDAKETIRLAPTWGKAYFRKAEVEYATQQYEDALCSYQLAYQLISEPILMESINRTKKALVKQQKFDKRIPWVGAGIAFIVGVIYVVGDAVIPKSPVLKHPVLQGLVAMAISLLGLALGNYCKWYIVSQRKSALEPPARLLDKEKDEEENAADGSHREMNSSSSSPNEEKKPHVRYSKAQARHRYRKGKS